MSETARKVIGPARGSAYVRGLRAQLVTVVVEIVVVLIAAFVLKIVPVLVAGIVAAILVGFFTPRKWQWLSSLAGFGGLAALAYFYFGAERMALLLVVLGVVFGAMGFLERRK